MKKLIQENGPAQVWVQSWLSDNGEDFSPAEPAAFPESDDWTAQLFNYYFLSGFGSDSEGSIDVNNTHFSALKKDLDSFFEQGQLSEIHKHTSEKWAEISNLCDEEANWFSVAWPTFEVDEYSGPALGFFFSRERNSFLSFSGDEPMILRGLPMKKPEYGCLIYPDTMGGFTLHILEPAKAENGGTAWSQALFPQFKMVDDAFHSKQFFKMCKSFSEDVLVKELKQPRENQVNFLSESLDFAKNKGVVNFENFKQEVIAEPTVRDAFEQFTSDYSETRKWNPPDQFAVSESSQKEAKKFVKSVIKLDKNFHIYVHGNKDRIEKGFDTQRKLNFYTLWFDAEV